MLLAGYRAETATAIRATLASTEVSDHEAETYLRLARSRCASGCGATIRVFPANSRRSTARICAGHFRKTRAGFFPAKPGEAISALDSKNKTAGSQNPTCPKHLSAADTDEELGQKAVAVLKEYNMIAVAMLPPAQAKQWSSAEPKRIIPGLFFNRGSEVRQKAYRCATRARRVCGVGRSDNAA